MRTRIPVVLVGLLWATAVHAAPPPKLVEARKLIDDLELEAALKALDAADKTEGNDRASVLEIYLLQGVAFGSLGKDAKTRDSFRKLLMLDPAAKLPPDQPPRVRTPFLEAKDWVATNGPLSATTEAKVDQGRVQALTVKVEKDVLRQARTARFHVVAGGPERTTDVALANGQAELPVDAPAVRWWVELLSERKGTLVELGTSAAPREASPGGASAVASGSDGALQVDQRAPVGGGWRRPTGFVLLGVGAVAAGVGAIFGAQSAAARAMLTGATRDADGRVTGLTQRDAGSLEGQANTQATLANVLFGVGGALGLAGLTLVIIGPDASPTVALSPAPGGLLVSGAF